MKSKFFLILTPWYGSPPHLISRRQRSTLTTVRAILSSNSTYNCQKWSAVLLRMLLMEYEVIVRIPLRKLLKKYCDSRGY